MFLSILLLYLSRNAYIAARPLKGHTFIMHPSDLSTGLMQDIMGWNKFKAKYLFRRTIFPAFVDFPYAFNPVFYK